MSVQLIGDLGERLTDLNLSHSNFACPSAVGGQGE